MNWMHALHQTYDAVSARIGPDRPWPVSHALVPMHVEVRLNAAGEWRGARALSREDSPTLIPVTELSLTRTSTSIKPHPLCEELSYCAADLPRPYKARYSAFVTQLRAWSAAGRHPKLQSVERYVERGTLWSDLRAAKLLPFKRLDATGRSLKIRDDKVRVRWSVEIPGEACSATWEDSSLMESWQAYDASSIANEGFCMVSGTSVRIAKLHPRFLRSSSDGAKLISSNDKSGFTYRGRFTDGDKDYGKQSCSVGYVITQKIHSSLRWLIERQGHRHGSDKEDQQVIVSWSVAAKRVPDPLQNTYELFLGVEPGHPLDGGHGDASQAFALRLRRLIAGYSATLDATDAIVVMGVDAPVPGRLSVIYYRNLSGSEFLDRLNTWHTACAWPQIINGKRFVGAPAPREIALAAFGRWDEKKRALDLDDRFLKSTVAELLPCIVDGRELPAGVVALICRRASQRHGLHRIKSTGFEHQWEHCLGVACSLYKALHRTEKYTMSLETERGTRDYLYGRLLAIADHIESRALYVAGEDRDTNAARYMQQFAERPATTWRQIRLALCPYESRLKVARGPFLHQMRTLLDQVSCLFVADDFNSDKPLSGEFLLGFHCQRGDLNPPRRTETLSEREADNL